MKNIISLSVLAAAILSMTACSSEKPKEKKALATVYKTATLGKSQISSSVNLPGVMQPFEFTMIYPKVSGFVKDVLVDRGSAVRKGQVLIRLEAPEIEEHASAAKLRYTQAHAMFITSKDRYRRLLETSATPGTVSIYDLAAAKAKMEADSATAQGEWADYKAQADMFNYLTVTAPFDGVITERNVHPGALAGPGAQGSNPMLILQQQSKLRLVINIPEAYSAQIKDGDNIHFKVNAIPGQDFTGKVSRSSNSLNDNYRSETIEVDVDNPKNVFKTGMYAEVELPVSGNASAFVVPKSSIVITTERKYVIAVDDNKAKWIDITEGNQSTDSAEAFGQLTEGQHIITNAGYQIKNGEPVNVQ